MMHLTDVEIVDFVDNALPPARAAHLERCDACRRQANDAREAWLRASEDDVPEPSPLFWEHFSARVHEAIRETNASSVSFWSRWMHHAGLRWALSGALVMALLVAAVWRVTTPSVDDAPAAPEARTSATPTAVDDQSAATDMLDTDSDPAWALVRTLADEVPWSDAVQAGLAARPDAAERAARTLTSDERSELMRLLEAETKRPGA